MVGVRLSCESVIVRNSGLVEAEVDNEIVALNIETGACYGLDPIGSRVWRLIAQPLAVKDLCTQLLSEYDVGATLCERDVIALLDDLQSEGLISVISTP